MRSASAIMAAPDRSLRIAVSRAEWGGRALTALAAIAVAAGALRPVAGALMVIYLVVRIAADLTGREERS